MPPAQKSLLVLAWLIGWVSIAPLFHIYISDTADRWSALRRSGVHIVFTPDPLGESLHPFAARHGYSIHLSQRVVNSLELGIDLFDEKSRDRKVKDLSAWDFSWCFFDGAFPSSPVVESPPKYSWIFPPEAFPAPRAPPPVVLL